MINFKDVKYKVFISYFLNRFISNIKNKEKDIKLARLNINYFNYILNETIDNKEEFNVSILKNVFKIYTEDYHKTDYKLYILKGIDFSKLTLLNNIYNIGNITKEYLDFLNNNITFLKENLLSYTEPNRDNLGIIGKNEMLYKEYEIILNLWYGESEKFKFRRKSYLMALKCILLMKDFLQLNIEDIHKYFSYERYIKDEEFSKKLFSLNGRYSLVLPF